jgi:hypothetical protein
MVAARLRILWSILLYFSGFILNWQPACFTCRYYLFFKNRFISNLMQHRKGEGCQG